MVITLAAILRSCKTRAVASLTEPTHLMLGFPLFLAAFNFPLHYCLFQCLKSSHNTTKLQQPSFTCFSFPEEFRLDLIQRLQRPCVYWVFCDFWIAEHLLLLVSGSSGDKSSICCLFWAASFPSVGISFHGTANGPTAKLCTVMKVT